MDPQEGLDMPRQLLSTGHVRVLRMVVRLTRPPEPSALGCDLWVIIVQEQSELESVEGSLASLGGEQMSSASLVPGLLFLGGLLEVLCWLLTCWRVPSPKNAGLFSHPVTL